MMDIHSSFSQSIQLYGQESSSSPYFDNHRHDRNTGYTDDGGRAGNRGRTGDGKGCGNGFANGEGKETCRTGQQVHQTIGFFTRIRLTTALFGLESCTAYCQVYTYLSLQYLGVPISLVALNGVIGGCGSVILVPIVGYLVDRGDPKKRKMVALFFGMTLLIVGYSIVITGCLLKISQGTGDAMSSSPTMAISSVEPSMTSFKRSTRASENDLISLYSEEERSRISSESASPTSLKNTDFNIIVNHSSEYAVSSSTDQSFHENDYQGNVTGASRIMEQTTETFREVDTGTYVPLTGILGILGHTMMDMGFDVGGPGSRAFILDHTPPSEHTSLLIYATLVASVAGIVMAIIGTFDLPAGLESLFQVDGTAATFILMLSLLIIITSCTYTNTVLTGLSLQKEMARGIHCMETNDATSPQHPQSKQIESKTAVTTKTHGIGKDEVKCFEKDNKHQTKGSRHKNKLNRNKATKRAISNETSKIIDSNEYTESSQDMASQVPSSMSSFCDRLSESTPYYSESTPLLQTDVGSHSSKHKTNNIGDVASTMKKTKQNEFLTTPIIILVVATIFSVSSIICFIMFIPNAITREIFHGDPHAPPDSEAARHYDEGLTASATGSLVLYIFYFLTCVVLDKVFKLIGEKFHYVICNILLATFTLVLLLTEKIEVYYVAMACFGLFRTCIFTLPFVLANKFTEEKEDDEKELLSDHQAEEQRPPQKNRSKVGRVMALIGVVIPSTKIVVSSVVGPAIDATGNAWVPLIWTCIGNVIALLVFILLFKY